MLRDMLKLEGFEVGGEHVRTLIGKMGICCGVPQAQDERSAPRAHPIYPYLLKSLVVDGPNQAWATDST